MDLGLLPLAFHLILIVASRLLHPYSSTDKTSRLMVKILHSEGHPERFTELHGEEKREEGDRGDQETMNIGGHVSLSLLVSSVGMPSSGIAGS